MNKDVRVKMNVNIWAQVHLDVYTSVRKMCLSTSCSSHAWPGGFWKWAWCVKRVSGVSAVMTNRCVLLLACLVYWIGGRTYNHTQPKHLCKLVCEGMLAKIISCTRVCPLLIKSVQLLHGKQTICCCLLASYSSQLWDQTILNQYQILFSAKVWSLIEV